jgi:DNA repair protein RecO (recombination protein O)
MRAKTEAIVVGKTPLRESSLLVTLLTEHYGLVRAVAKGVRSPRKRFWAPLQLLAHLEVVLYRRKTKNIAILSSAEAVDMHAGMAGDPYRFGYGCALAELARAVAPVEQRSDQLLMLLSAGLKAMEQAPTDGLEAVFWGVCLKALYLLGHGPRLVSCARCNRELGTDRWFSVSDGGMLCPACRGQQRAEEATRLPLQTAALLDTLMTESLEAVAHRRYSRTDFSPVSQLLDRFLSYHLGVRPGQKSLQYLAQVARLSTRPPRGQRRVESQQ